MKRIPTGITGLDELIEGGFPEGRCIIVAGMPGSGKTTFAVQYVYKGVKEYGENGVFATLNENATQIKEEMHHFGWNLNRIERGGRIITVDLSPTRYSQPETRMKIGLVSVSEFKVETIVTIIKANAEKIKAKRISIDPVTPLIIQGNSLYEKSLNFMRLLQAFDDTDYTVVMTTDMRENVKRLPGNIDFLQSEEASAPGVIILSTTFKDEEPAYALQIMKMRGTKHDKKLHPYQITDKGIVVYPQKRLYPKFF